MTNINQTLPENLSPDEHTLLEQSMNQDQQRALQEGTPDATKTIQPAIAPHFPAWPTSKPGPQSTPPSPGQRPINPLRSEQMMEINYNQETGTPSSLSPLRSMPDPNRQGPVSLDQDELAPEAHKLPKKRL